MKTNSRITTLILLCIIVSLLFGYVTYRELKVGDFEDHIGWARNLAANGYVFVPAHSLYEELIVTVRAFLPYNVLAKSSKLLHQIIDIKSYEIAAVVVTILTYLAFAILIYNRLLHEWKKDEKEANPWLAGLITLVAMLVSPIFLFTLPDRMYMGYLTANPYHNPTQLLLRPFALLLFYHAYTNLYERPRLKSILVAAVLMIAATQSKANFTLIFLPALGILALLQFRKLKNLNWLYVIFGLGLPGVGTLIAQFFISMTGQGVDKMIFAPFKAILMFVPNLWALLFFTILSLVFPLVVTFGYWQQNRHNFRLGLAWIVFLVGFVLACLFTQVINMASLNFWWGPMIAVVILFVESFCLAGKYGMFSLRESTGRIQRWAGLAALGLHLLCGIIYYLNTVLYPSPYL